MVLPTVDIYVSLQSFDYPFLGMGRSWEYTVDNFQKYGFITSFNLVVSPVHPNLTIIAEWL